MRPRPDVLFSDMEEIYHTIVEHPFVAGLTDGSLPRTVFRHYVVQDAHYLLGYARALARNLLGLARLPGKLANRLATDAGRERAAARLLGSGFGRLHFAGRLIEVALGRPGDAAEQARAALELASRRTPQQVLARLISQALR